LEAVRQSRGSDERCFGDSGKEAEDGFGFSGQEVKVNLFVNLS